MNVFVTIGSQEPFARLLSIVDELAPRFPGLRFTAQTTSGDNFEGRHMVVHSFIPPVQFRQYLQEADLVIAHAGIGTILNVLEQEKPLLVFPRRACYHETRDDHQVATVKAFSRQGLVHVAESKEELEQQLQAFLDGRIRAGIRITPHASPNLLESLSEFIGE